jgi:hypothetical protein
VAAASSSTIPAVTAGPSDSTSTNTAAQSGGASGASRGSKVKKSGSKSGKTPVTSTKRNTNAARDTGILGRDSVIRFPRRTLPTASSTPVRK